MTDAGGAKLDLLEVAAGTADLALARTGKVMFQVHLAPGSRLRAVTVAPR